jgi:hypothetical protein
MDAAGFHRELLLPSPAKESPGIPPLVWTSKSPFWLEIHREEAGRVRYSLGSVSYTDLESMVAYLENARPRLAAGHSVECALAERVHRGILARSVPLQKHHHLPIRLRPESDAAGFLLRTLSSRTLRGHDVALQLLFRRVKVWESGFFSPSYDTVADRQSRELRAEMDARRAEAAYHVEMRARISGPQPAEALTALGAWLEQWTTSGGVPWRSWKTIPTKTERDFHAAFWNHDLGRFASKKGHRDVSATELAHLLGIPWAAHHPECSYAGAPPVQPRPEAALRPVSSAVTRPPVAVDGTLTSFTSAAQTRVVGRTPAQLTDTRLAVGSTRDYLVGLPQEWNHLAILGRTQSGKSTLALNLILQILEKQPGATVVVIEPTGMLVEGLMSRLSHEVATDTVEIDPAHVTFERDGTTMVSVPLSLLQPPDRPEGDASNRDRWSEGLAGDLLIAIRNAWGEESIGGRAELVLRALVQGLSLTPGSNLVDAYHILSSKQALQRFVKTAPPGPLRDFLERHLPRLDYDFTMSSLDKVGKIATNPLLRIALCQRAQPVSFERLLGHRLLLLNLSKPALGSEGANFLGAIYLTQLWASIQRTGRPSHPVYLVLDEVHNYAVPTFADMLSEGAKFGLHVVAITQYLHRVPPRVRAAILGNVNAWLLFSLGVEDMEDAWKIVNGTTHGWRPQDLVDGLRPHEVAMAVSGDLVKLATLPSPPPSPLGSDLKGVVTRSSRRYAQPEDSEASPWLVGQEEAEGSLQDLSGGPRTRDELGEVTQLPANHLEGTLTRLTAAGDVVRSSMDGRFHLTARGSLHLKALQGRRNEGEEHVETLTELAMFLESRGIALSVPKQVAGVLLPDGQFQWGDAVYNVEVECSTLAKASDQVVRNLKKARSAGYRPLIVLPERSQVPRALALLDEAFPGMRLWIDGVGLVWKEGRASFRPHRVGGTRVWPFLDSGADSVTAEVAPLPRTVSPEARDTDPLISHVRAAIRALVVSGKTEASPQEVLAALPTSERLEHTEQQVGIALSTLGLTRRRSRLNGTRFRVYNLRTSGPADMDGGVRASGGPTRWPDSEIDSIAGKAGPQGRAADSSIDNDGAGPTDPTGPDD